MATDTKNYPDIIKGINAGIAGLKKQIPDTLSGFGGLSKAAHAEGALDHKTKELLALAISVAIRCDGCIGFHTKKLRELGATDAEVAETLGVAVSMGGGPALMYAGDAWTSWQQFGG